MDFNAARSVSLSPREVEVAVALASGQSTKQIARRLGIARRTVYFHLTSIKRKLGTSSRDEAIALLAQFHIIESL